MPALLRTRLTILAAVAALGAALPACGTDDAIERDTEDAGQKLDEGAGNADEKAGEAAEDAGDEIEKGAEDVDGQLGARSRGSALIDRPRRGLASYGP